MEMSFEGPVRRPPQAAGRREKDMKRRTLAATASAIFAAGIVTTAQAQTAGGVKCVGVNSCKGTSACKSANSSCKGMNSCKGQGWTVTTDVSSCTSRGGKVAQ